jgi:hypothetical protein
MPTQEEQMYLDVLHRYKVKGTLTPTQKSTLYVVPLDYFVTSRYVFEDKNEKDVLMTYM